MYDLTTMQETQITTSQANQTFPAISEDIIAWRDERNAPSWSRAWDIYTYDLKTGEERRITPKTATQSEAIEYSIGPEVDQNKIVWQDFRNNNWDIFMYDLTTNTEVPVATGIAEQMDPKISGNRIMWRERNNKTDLYVSLHLFDLSTSKRFQIASNQYAWCFRSDIDQDKIAWSVLNGAYWVLYLRDISAIPLYGFTWLAPEKNPDEIAAETFCFNKYHVPIKFRLTTTDGELVENQNVKVVVSGAGVAEEFVYGKGSQNVRINSNESHYIVNARLKPLGAGIQRGQTYTVSVYFDNIKYGQALFLLK